jgi:hypothetical protein
MIGDFAIDAGHGRHPLKQILKLMFAHHLAGAVRSLPCAPEHKLMPSLGASLTHTVSSRRAIFAHNKYTSSGVDNA